VQQSVDGSGTGRSAGGRLRTRTQRRSQGNTRRSRSHLAPAALAEGKKYLLPSEPAGAKGVIDVRKDAKDGEEVVVVGRVGGSSTPFTPGRTSFLIVDCL
jgi:hypothetical protein